MFRIARLLVALSCALLCWLGAARGGDEPAAGKVHPAVSARHDPKQSYALFLPPGYAADRKWPILYAFSPSAQGHVPAKLFERAAAKFGWIVAASNNSRNGPPEPVQAALEAIWKDTHERFSLDESRLYATGFSGGARVAYLLALTKKNFAGVVPCGAGFPSRKEVPEAGSKLLVCGLVGLECFNLPEMLGMEATLNSLGLQNRLLVFKGGHNWPPEEYAYRAVRYLELDARCAAGRAGEEASLALLDEELEEAERLLEKPETLYEGYQRLKEWEPLFKQTPRHGKLAEKVAQLEAGEAFKKEDAAAQAVKKVREGLKAIANEEEQFQETVKRLGEIRATYPETAAGRRVIIQLESLPRRLAEAGSQLLQAKRFAESIVYLNRAALLLPESNKIQYLLAQAHANLEKKAEACSCLEKAVALGFGDARQLQQDPAFKGLLEEQAFKDLLAKIPSKPAKPPEQDPGPKPEAPSAQDPQPKAGASAKPEQDAGLKAEGPPAQDPQPKIGETKKAGQGRAAQSDAPPAQDSQPKAGQATKPEQGEKPQ